MNKMEKWIELLPNVPLVESPFFDQIFTPDNFDTETLEIAKNLNKKGFAVIDFPDDIDNLAEKINSTLHSLFDWEAYRNGNVEGLRIPDLWKTNKTVRRIAANEKILQILSSIYGRRAIPFQTLNFPTGTQQHFHSDAIHFNCKPERFMCGVWVALENIDQSNGPLEYYPGSHKLPIYTNEHIGKNPPAENLLGNYEFYIKLWTELVNTHNLKREEFHPKKGQALIWLANLFHGGAKQLDKTRTRWSQVTHYFFENCCYYQPLTETPLKKLSIRNIIDIKTGLPVKSILNEEIITEPVKTVKPMSWLKNIKRKIRRGLKTLKK